MGRNRTSKLFKASTASMRRHIRIRSSKKPTNMQRMFLALKSLSETHLVNTFPVDNIMKQVEADAARAGEILGPRTRFYIELALHGAAHSDYIRLDSESKEVKILTSTTTMLQEIKGDVETLGLTLESTKYRTYCAHIQFRVGRSATHTKTELYNEIQRLSEEVSRLKPTSLAEDVEMDDISISDAEEFSAPVMGNTPCRTLHNVAIAYPTPNSLPRHSNYPSSLGLPPSPMPVHHPHSLDDNMMDNNIQSAGDALHSAFSPSSNDILRPNNIRWQFKFYTLRAWFMRKWEVREIKHKEALAECNERHAEEIERLGKKQLKQQLELRKQINGLESTKADLNMEVTGLKRRLQQMSQYVQTFLQLNQQMEELGQNMAQTSSLEVSIANA